MPVLIVISPAKSLDFESPTVSEQNSLPVFTEEAQQLINQLQKYSAKKISKLMGLSDNPC